MGCVLKWWRGGGWRKEITATLARMEKQLGRIEAAVQHPTAGGFRYNAKGGVPRPSSGGGAMLEVTCTDAEKFRIQVVPVTTSGKPSKIQAGSLVVTPVTDGSTGANPVATIEGDDTFTVQADFAPDAASAVQLFTVEGDADLGAGVVTISDTVTLNVTSEQATNLGLTSLGAVSR